MANREVSVGLCSAIVGVLIGAGSVTYAEDVSGSLAGNLYGTRLSYRNFEMDEAFRRRTISEYDRKVRPQAGIFEGGHRAPEEEAPREFTEEDKQACYTKVKIAEELRGIIIPLVPGRPIDQLVRHSMSEAFDAYVEDCQPHYDAIHEMMQVEVPVVEEAPSIEFVPNYEHCTQYTGGRRSRCIVEERRNNIEYQGGQYYRR